MDIFDHAVASVMQEIAVVDNSIVMLDISKKQRSLLNEMLNVLNTLDERTLIVIQKPDFEHKSIDGIWFDWTVVDNVYLQLVKKLAKSIDKLTMSNKHIYEILELPEVAYDDCIDVVYRVKNMTSTCKISNIERQLFMKKSMNEIKLDKEKKAIEDYIVSLTLL